MARSALGCAAGVCQVVRMALAWAEVGYGGGFAGVKVINVATMSSSMVFSFAGATPVMIEGCANTLPPTGKAYRERVR